MAPSRSPEPAERGVALLIVLVVLFIIAVLMVDITLTATTARRSAGNATDDFLMEAAIDGWFTVMSAHLVYDAKENKFDSPDDRWADPRYANSGEAGGDDADPTLTERAADEESDMTAVGDSDDFPVEATCVPENARFNLNLLMHPDAKQREAARERLAVLIDRFREDTPLDISTTKAADIAKAIVEYLERAAPGEGETGKLPVAKAGPWRILTPDELLCVEGLEDSAHSLGPEGILYAAADPKAVREHELDPDNVKEPPLESGLIRYITLWSGSAWIGQAAPDSWLAINVNHAEKPVLETLFYRNPTDFVLAERIVEYREAAKEGQPAAATTGEEKELHQYFEKLEDLKKVDGLDDAALQRNGIGAPTATVQSDTFSLYLWVERKGKPRDDEDPEAEPEDPPKPTYKQVRYVVRRNNQGIQTLLREERTDFPEDVKVPKPVPEE